MKAEMRKKLDMLKEVAEKQGKSEKTGDQFFSEGALFAIRQVELFFDEEEKRENAETEKLYK